MRKFIGESECCSYIVEGEFKALAAYSTRKLISTHVGETCERAMSGYVSTWYDQSGNGKDIHWDFETETNSMLWELRYEMAQDFLNLALEMGLETQIKFPTCVQRVAEGKKFLLHLKREL
jgi:hypothetical protein